MRRHYERLSDRGQFRRSRIAQKPSIPTANTKTSFGGIASQIQSGSGVASAGKAGGGGAHLWGSIASAAKPL